MGKESNNILVTFINLAGERLQRKVELSANSFTDENDALEQAKKAVRMYYRLPSDNVLEAKFI